MDEVGCRAEKISLGERHGFQGSSSDFKSWFVGERGAWNGPQGEIALESQVGQCQLGIEEIMMIINHVTEGMISDHVIGGQNVISYNSGACQSNL